MINPQIRFKKPDGSAFADFHAVRLGDCLQSVSVKKKQLVAEIYSVSNSAGFVPQVEQFDGRDNIASEDTSGYKLVKRGEFAYNPSRINVGSLARLDNKEFVAVSPLYVVFRIVQYLDSNYFLNWFGTSSFRRGMLKNIEGGVRDSLSYDGLSDIVIVCPSDVVEQQKVAQFLSEIDNLIQSAENELEATKQLKKAMLQKMFPKKGEKVPEVRFPGFTGDWEQRKLGDIFKEYSEKNHEELPALTIIQGTGTIRREESERNLQYDKSNLKGYKLVREGDFIVHLRSFEGGLEKANTDGIVSPAYHMFHGDNTDTRFWYPYFRSYDFINNKLKPHVYGIRDGRSIDIEGMKSIKIMVPAYNEQRQIGGFIEMLDNLITLHQRKCDAYRKFKKALMQKMFV